MGGMTAGKVSFASKAYFTETPPHRSQSVSNLFFVLSYIFDSASSSEFRKEERIMSKLIKKLSLVAIALIGGASQASTYYSGEPAYLTTMYSDSTLQTEVGYIRPECTQTGVRYRLEGTYTQYQRDEYVGTCGAGGFEPIE